LDVGRHHYVQSVIAVVGVCLEQRTSADQVRVLTLMLTCPNGQHHPRRRWWSNARPVECQWTPTQRRYGGETTA